MTGMKLTVRRLYRIQNDRLLHAQAVVHIFVGDVQVVKETISGMTESPVSKYLHHDQPRGQNIRVEWECEGIADMIVTELAVCPCCQPSGV